MKTPIKIREMIDRDPSDEGAQILPVVLVEDLKEKLNELKEHLEDYFLRDDMPNRNKDIQEIIKNHFGDLIDNHSVPEVQKDDRLSEGRDLNQKGVRVTKNAPSGHISLERIEEIIDERDGWILEDLKQKLRQEVQHE